MRAQSTHNKAFTLVEIMIVVSIIGLVASIAIPNFIHAKTNSQKSVCIANLKQIDGAIQLWAMDYKKSASDSVSETAIVYYLKSNSLPEEPAGGAYNLTIVSDAPTCSLGTTLGHTCQ